MLGQIDWNPPIAALAASLPVILAIAASWIALRHKLADMELTGLKTLHHVNSGSVTAAQALETARHALMVLDKTPENVAAYKAAVIRVAEAIATQEETAKLIRVAKPVKTSEPPEVVLADTAVKSGGELATKDDVIDAIHDAEADENER